jgi:SNF2 family DNA or RNA helicase
LILKQHCSYCKEKKEVTRVLKDENGLTRFFACGHMQRVNYVKPSDFANITSSDNKTPYPFQLEGAAFAANANFRALIADECGLGKTVQGLSLLSRPETLPALVICKAGLRMQWVRETHRWIAQHGQVIISEKEPNLGLKVAFISMDLLHRFKDMEAFVKRFGFKTIILDECQAIKNHDSKRTNAIRALSSHIPYFIALSGTPIKNHAGEYFPILNILRPDLFPTLRGFYNDWTDSYFNGYSMKTAGLRPGREELFQTFTKDFIIRRTKSEVLPQLPKVARQPLFSELGKDVEKAYLKELDEFEDYYNSGKDAGNPIARGATLIGFFSRMRHLTGLSKIDPCVAWTEEFLMSTSKKLVIFVHHKDVATILKEKLRLLTLSWPSEYGAEPLTLEAEHDMRQRQDAIDQFQSSNSRILIASTLAAGEGVDGIQNVCSDIVILERQWNPANEEQVEGRIERMGQNASNLTSTYMIATGTIDEFFAEIVERKRVYVANTLDGVVGAKWNENSIMKELAESLSLNGRKRWSW